MKNHSQSAQPCNHQEACASEQWIAWNDTAANIEESASMQKRIFSLLLMTHQTDALEPDEQQEVLFAITELAEKSVALSMEVKDQFDSLKEQAATEQIAQETQNQLIRENQKLPIGKWVKRLSDYPIPNIYKQGDIFKITEKSGDIVICTKGHPHSCGRIMPCSMKEVIAAMGSRFVEKLAVRSKPAKIDELVQF